MRILAIETSCDETAIAIAEFRGAKRNAQISVLSNIVSSQVKLHAKFGGVVPNLAKREHQKNLAPILLRAMKEARMLAKKKIQLSRDRFLVVSRKKIEKILERESELLRQFKKQILPLKTPDIDAIAVTCGPGLAPALWVGVNFAKALAYLWKKPLIPVNHMEGHLFSALLQEQRISKSEFLNSKLSQRGHLEKQNDEETQRSFTSFRMTHSQFQVSGLKFPALALLVSGGHTELALVKGYKKYKIIGETLDDAAGEAFDKVARILGLGYPGGPEIAKISNLYEATPHKDYEALPHKIKMPRPMLNSSDYNFSFSGLKTAVLYLTRDLGKVKTKKLRPAIAKEFQDAVVEVLVAKTIRAAREYKVKTILLGGGVAANKLLRGRLAVEIKKNLPTTNHQLPTLYMTGDNALMIALAAYFAGKKIAPSASWRIGADANVKL